MLGSAKEEAAGQRGLVGVWRQLRAFTTVWRLDRGNEGIFLIYYLLKDMVYFSSISSIHLNVLDSCCKRHISFKLPIGPIIALMAPNT
jgi:hypothetical protein